MQNIVLTITQLNTYVKRIIDAEDLISNISVFGEISNFKISGNNAYFDIKEEGAQISCVMFGAYSLNQKNGDKVLVTGKLNYSVKIGKLSFVANKVEPYGQGELYARYMELKNKLESEGVFDERYKKSLPRFASKVGVVTSETGAVIRDIYNVTKRKNPYTQLIVYPAKVQGVGAENEIIEGLKYFEESDVDVVIVARGGGSFEDFSAFNNEKIVRVVFDCKKPIITGVGHETDFSLIDFVADMRAPTPSVAAELAVFDFNVELNNIIRTVDFINSKMDQLMMQKKQETSNAVSLSINVMEKVLTSHKLAIDGLISNIERSFETGYNERKSKLDLLEVKLSKSNPLELLRRGFSRTTVNGKTIEKTNDVKIGDEIQIELKDGTIISEVKVVKEKK